MDFPFYIHAIVFYSSVETKFSQLGEDCININILANSNFLTISFISLKCVTNGPHSNFHKFWNDFENLLKIWKSNFQIRGSNYNFFHNFQNFSWFPLFLSNCVTNGSHNISQGFWSDFEKSPRNWNLNPWIRGGGTNINILVAFIFSPDFLLCFSNALQIALIAVLGGFEVILKNLQTNCNL